MQKINMILVLCKTKNSRGQLFNRLLHYFKGSRYFKSVNKSANSVELQFDKDEVTVFRFECEEEASELFIKNLEMLYYSFQCIKEDDFMFGVLKK